MQNDRATEALDATAKFHSGAELGAHRFFGFHREGDRAVFRVWAPRADRVSVIGDFNGWDESSAPLHRADAEGCWEIVLNGEEIADGSFYKFCIRSGERRMEKADPFAIRAELPPKTASVIATVPAHPWRDTGWLAYRGRAFAPEAAQSQPIRVYALHAGAWMRSANGGALSYRELAAELVHYVKQMGFSHVELMPLAEHPDDASQGYATSGLFAPTARYGTPEELMELVDTLHEAGVGVMLDLPTEFATDAHALCAFDGEPLLESREQPSLPDLERPEVQSFLLSSLAYWIETYHIDGLCLSAAAMAKLSDRTAELFGTICRSVMREFPDVMLITAGQGSDFADTDADTADFGSRLTDMLSCAGRKRIFMGNELGQADALRDGGVDWSLLDRAECAALQQRVAELNHQALAEEHANGCTD